MVVADLVEVADEAAVPVERELVEAVVVFSVLAVVLDAGVLLVEEDELLPVERADVPLVEVADLVVVAVLVEADVLVELVVLDELVFVSSLAAALFTSVRN